MEMRQLRGRLSLPACPYLQPRLLFRGAGPQSSRERATSEGFRYEWRIGQRASEGVLLWSTLLRILREDTWDLVRSLHSVTRRGISVTCPEQSNGREMFGFKSAICMRGKWKQWLLKKKGHLP